MSLFCEMLVDLPCFVSLPFCYKIEFWLVVRLMQDKIDRLTRPFLKSASTESVTLKNRRCLVVEFWKEYMSRTARDSVVEIWIIFEDKGLL